MSNTLLQLFYRTPLCCNHSDTTITSNSDFSVVCYVGGVHDYGKAHMSNSYVKLEKTG
jgi:hypothetical protein